MGSPGRRAFRELVPVLREEQNIDLVVANGENAAGGRGITPKMYDELREAGADIITLGDHTWDQRDLAPWLSGARRILRPANFAPACPGTGIEHIDVGGTRVTVIDLIGRVFMNPYDCPFRTVNELLQSEEIGQVVIVEIHGEATSEKIAMGWHLHGRASSVAGTHTHVQTADETILPQGTAYITDLGMTGPRHSVLGRDVQPVLHRFKTGMPAKFSVAGDETPQLEGIVVEIDEQSGKALSIHRIRKTTEPA